MHSRATTEGGNSQIRPSTIVRAARAAGSHPHLASVLLQGLKSTNIYASSGVIRGILVYMSCRTRTGLSSAPVSISNAGTFNYHCGIHGPQMNGKITVT